jgi:hypothetical protein
VILDTISQKVVDNSTVEASGGKMQVELLNAGGGGLAWSSRPQ